MANYTLRINGVVRQFFVKTTRNKRSFLKASIPAGGGFMIGFNWHPSHSETSAAELPDDNYDINASLQIDRGGKVTVKPPALDVTQFDTTAIPMIVADELDIDLGRVSMAGEHTHSHSAADVQALITLHPAECKSVQLAGATARRMLIQAAANRWGTPVGELSTESGRVIHKKTGRSVEYGHVAEYAACLQIPDEVELKDPATS